MNRQSNRFARKMRARRENREFESALRTASPAMQFELLAAAARTRSNH